jgi:hypothetical protein
MSLHSIVPEHKKRPNSRAKWRKSSVRSDGDWVGVAYSDEFIGVRDTKDSGIGPILAFNKREWIAFLEGTANGEFTYEHLRATS